MILHASLTTAALGARAQTRWESTANSPLDTGRPLRNCLMKLRYAAVFAAAPLAQAFVPARAAIPKASVVVRSEPVEINAPTVYSHWSANVNEEACPRRQ